MNDHDDVLEMVVLGAVETPAPLELISREVLVGLSSSPKHIPCMFMYDDTGSDIYADITELEEYYPTRTEAAILERHKEALAVAAAAPTPELCDAALAALDAGRPASDVFSGKLCRVSRVWRGQLWGQLFTVCVCRAAWWCSA